MKPIQFPLALLATALLIAPTLSVSEEATEDAAHPHRKGAERLKSIGEKLDLTEEQKTKVKEIFEKSAPKVKEIRQDTALSVADRRAKLMEIRKSEMEEMRAVLTPEQQEKWKAARADRKGRPKVVESKFSQLTSGTAAHRSEAGGESFRLFRR